MKETRLSDFPSDCLIEQGERDDDQSDHATPSFPFAIVSDTLAPATALSRPAGGLQAVLPSNDVASLDAKAIPVVDTVLLSRVAGQAEANGTQDR